MLYFFSLVNIAIIFGILAVTQGILLNRLKLAFAGALIVAGLSAYFFASLANEANSTLVLILLILSIWLLLWFQDRLKGDYYLLSSLALLEIISSVTSFSLSGLGGREGLTVDWLNTISSSNFEIIFLFITIPAAVLTILAYFFLFRSNLGVFIDRIGAMGNEAKRWINTRKVIRIIFMLAVIVFFLIGILYLLYTGGVTPSIFSLDLAFLLIIFTILSLRSSLIGFLAVLFYYTLPWIVTKSLSIFSIILDRSIVSEIILVIWGIAIVILAIKMNIDGNKVVN